MLFLSHLATFSVPHGILNGGTQLQAPTHVQEVRARLGGPGTRSLHGDDGLHWTLRSGDKSQPEGISALPMPPAFPVGGGGLTEGLLLAHPVLALLRPDPPQAQSVPLGNSSINSPHVGVLGQPFMISSSREPPTPSHS